MNHSHENRRSYLGIPPRWLNCPRKGCLVAGKFLPFKTPLSSVYDDKVPLANRFTPNMLITSLKSYKVKMGFWIDLTNTDRFYRKEDVEETDIKYLKLQCRGHGECPSEDQTQTFIQLCHKYISKNPMNIIGVHCTHGFNRTGFLIVAYLVEVLDWSVEAAIDEFSKARTPGIYKEDYLQELFKRYGDPCDTPPPPQLPEWCNEPDTFDDDGCSIEIHKNENRNDGTGIRKRRREFNKKNPTFMDGVPGITPITTQPHLSEIQMKCQEMCGWNGSGFPGSQPVSMDTENVNLLQQKPYKVSWKADGTRYMMLINGENQVYFIDRDNAVFQVSGLDFPQRKEASRHICETLLDGEMIIDKVNGHDVPRYLIYDIVRFEGINVGDCDFDRRLLCIGKEIIATRQQAMKEGRIDRNKEPFSVRRKEFWDVSQAKSILSEKFTKGVTHDIDGLIFQPAVDRYIPGRCLDVLKWKPPNLNSVDFKLLIVQERREGCLPGPKGYLYVGGHDQPFAEIKVTKSLKIYDKKIIECKYEDNQWKFLRERTDKSFPNGYKTALAVCNSIRDPVTKDKLFNFIENNRWKPPVTKRSHPESLHTFEETEPSSKLARR